MENLVKKAIEAVLEQGMASVSDTGQCRYRQGEVLKCAIGHLIPDEHYSESLENKAVNYSYVMSDDTEVFPVKDVLRKVYPEITEVTLRQLKEVQIAHDSASSAIDGKFIEKFKDNLKFSIDHNDLPEEYLCYTK